MRLPKLSSESVLQGNAPLVMLPIYHLCYKSHIPGQPLEVNSYSVFSSVEAMVVGLPGWETSHVPHRFPRWAVASLRRGTLPPSSYSVQLLCQPQIP